MQTFLILLPVFKTMEFVLNVIFLMKNPTDSIRNVMLLFSVIQLSQLQMVIKNVIKLTR